MWIIRVNNGFKKVSTHPGQIEFLNEGELCKTLFRTLFYGRIKKYQEYFQSSLAIIIRIIQLYSAGLP